MVNTSIALPFAAPPASVPPVELSELVGAAHWAQLPPALRGRFQPTHRPARYEGTMALERSAAGAVFAWLAIPFGAPLPWRPTAGLPTTVRVSPQQGGMLWERAFGADHVIRSLKLPGPNGQLLERTEGGLGMVLGVSVQDGALVFTSRRFFLALGRWRIPIPALLTPGRCRVEHRAIGEACFRFTLTMTHPLWGVTFRQTGLFTDSLEDLP